MAIKMSNTDHDRVDRVLKQLLAWHGSGEIKASAATAVLSHLVLAAASDDEKELRAWLDDREVLEDWKRGHADVWPHPQDV